MFLDISVPLSSYDLVQKCFCNEAVFGRWPLSKSFTLIYMS